MSVFFIQKDQLVVRLLASDYIVGFPAFLIQKKNISVVRPVMEYAGDHLFGTVFKIQYEAGNRSLYGSNEGNK